MLGAVLLVACRDPTAGPGWLSGARPPLPVYRAARTTAAISVDGRLDEPAWAQAERVEFVDSVTGLPPHYRTEARLLWDESTLHVGFICDDDEAWVRPGRKHDDPIYEDEVVELFLVPGQGRGYFEIEVSPAGVLFDARFAAVRKDLDRARAWSSEARVATAVDGGITVGYAAPLPARSWTVELALPWTSLGLVPRVGERWRMNLYRLESHNRRRVVEGSSFSPPLRRDFHALDRFGWLELGP
ncbi:MAG TPA: carbohydrate-binding family 9-like protein [Anaeromyxobacteraceae bacterium]|nr:carbohydrate-binding family 9-like protein [Anaeromyxobacteraceae bacterium]